MRRVVLIGGTGQIGRAAARALAPDGWEVVAVSRSGTLPAGLAELGVRAVPADREDDEQLRAAVGDGADVVVDTVAYTGAHGEQLNGLAGLVESLVVVSSASVYADGDGRTLDEANEGGDFPRFPLPIPETQRTTEPGDETYSTRKVALEQTVLAGSVPATVVRPCAIHGPGARLPRELFFVKRIRDGRRACVLVSNGGSRFHTTSVANLAELIRLAAGSPADRVLNCGDPDPPTTREIGEAIITALDAELELVGIPESGYRRPEVSNPWGVPRPLVVEMTAAVRELGYRPVTSYPEAVGETCEWLAGELERGRTWQGTYLEDYFDYAAEDEALRSVA
jgi:nucleoside-diphosphate-sugar epimerase